MGGDGGQVIDRATMVKTKGWGLTKSSENGGRYAASLGEMANYMQQVTEDRGLGTLEKHRTAMSQCFLSQEALREPVVACKLGNLYNKEAMIGAILNKSIPAGLAHIKKLSDLKNCIVTWKEAENEDNMPGLYKTEKHSLEVKKRMVCPVSREDLDSGGARSVVIWTSGVVVSVKSLKELKAKECPVTGKPFDFDQDAIWLAPNDEEFAKLKARLPVAKKRKVESLVNAATSGKASESGIQMPQLTSEKATGATVWNPHLKPYSASSKETGGEEKKAKKAPVLGKDMRGKANQALEANLDLLPNSGRTGTQQSELYKSLFTSDRNGMEGTRDAFGKPCYNRGSRCM